MIDITFIAWPVDIFFVKSVQLNLVRAGTYSLWSPLITIISAVTSVYLFSKFIR